MSGSWTCVEWTLTIIFFYITTTLKRFYCACSSLCHEICLTKFCQNEPYFSAPINRRKAKRCTRMNCSTWKDGWKLKLSTESLLSMSIMSYVKISIVYSGVINFFRHYVCLIEISKFSQFFRFSIKIKNFLQKNK